MATYTENILLTLRDPTDAVDVESFNRDNRILDTLLGPVAVDYAVLRSAARINAYNAMKSMRHLHYAGINVPEKNAMFFGDFDTEAESTSKGALHIAEKHGYAFSKYQGESFAYGQPGDVATTTSDNAATSQTYFSFTAPVSGYITSIELDIQAKATGYTTYVYDLTVGDYEMTNNLKFGSTPTTRGIQTYTFTAPLAVHKGDVITGNIRTTSAGNGAYVYGAVLGEPYVKFNCAPATDEGWIQTALGDLGSMGHNEARIYIQCMKDNNGTLTAALVDESGTELELLYAGSRTTVTKDGDTCIELCFIAPFNERYAALKISAAANEGYVDIYNYAVTAL